MKQLYIDGAWTDGTGGRTWSVTNPATGEHMEDVAVASAEDVDLAVGAARRAFDEGPWPRMDPLARGRMLQQLSKGIRDRLEDFAMIDTLNVGKPIRDTRGFDVPCAADLFESYAGLPDKIAGKCYGTLPENVTMQFREPMGAIAAIVPWNFPLTNAAIKLAPVLACGNTVVLKPSEISPLSALMLAELAHEIGFPPGVINVVHGTGAETGTALVRHPGIDKITFTGRHQTGVQMLEAAKVGMKGVLLELGGKTASLVFPDASLEHVVNNAGFGIVGEADATDVDRVLNMVRLNVSATVDLTHRLLPDMLARGHGAILNVSSLSAFQPVAYMGAYAASKAFVLHFSESLHCELKERGITVTAVCPGVTRTAFFDIAGAPGWLQKHAALDVDYVVKKSLQALASRRQCYIPGWRNFWLTLLVRCASRRRVVKESMRFFRPKRQPTSP